LRGEMERHRGARAAILVLKINKKKRTRFVVEM